jgi:hypothetical protein
MESFAAFQRADRVGGKSGSLGKFFLRQARALPRAPQQGSKERRIRSRWKMAFVHCRLHPSSFVARFGIDHSQLDSGIVSLNACVCAMSSTWISPGTPNWAASMHPPISARLGAIQTNIKRPESSGARPPIGSPSRPAPADRMEYRDHSPWRRSMPRQKRDQLAPQPVPARLDRAAQQASRRE